MLVPSRDGGLADCAICLDTPTAPRMTKCGHLYCASCILRHLDGHRCRRCPLCFETVARGDLRPVSAQRRVAFVGAGGSLRRGVSYPLTLDATPTHAPVLVRLSRFPRRRSMMPIPGWSSASSLGSKAR